HHQGAGGGEAGQLLEAQALPGEPGVIDGGEADAAEEAAPGDALDDGAAGEGGLDALEQGAAARLDLGEELGAIDEIEDAQGDAAGEGVAAQGAAVDLGAQVAAVGALPDAGAHDGGADGDHAAAERLGEGEDVGRGVLALEGEEGAGAADA